MKRIYLIGLMPLLCLVILAAYAPAQAADEIKIGVIGPMQFPIGKHQWWGAQMAADEINAQGGIKVGRKKMKIKLYKADSNELFSVPAAVNAMERLLLRDKVDFVMGGFRTEAVLAMQDLAMDNKTIFWGVGAAHPELCARVARNYDRYKYWFRGAPWDARYILKNIFIQTRSVSTLMKSKLEIETFRVAIVAEKTMFVDAIAKQAEAFLPQMGMEVVGVWRPSSTAKDVNAEVAAIQKAKPHIILSLLTGPVGIPFARMVGELKIPAVQLGFNVSAQHDKFMDLTQGHGNYVFTSTAYVPGVEFNELTAPYVNAFIEKYGEVPTYNAETYTVMKHAIKLAVEETGSLDPDKIIPLMEQGINKGPSGVIACARDEQGRHLHDLKWGPGYTTGLGAQWQDGRLVGVWPHFKWITPYWEYSVTPPEEGKQFEHSIKGLKAFKLPPWVLAAYPKKDSD